MTDDLDRRLRESAPPVDPDAFDAALLARVQAQPEPAARRPRYYRAAIPVLAAAVLAFVLLGRGPEPASAIDQALHWFNPPAGKVLHIRLVDANGDTDELWQSTDDPAQARTLATRDGKTYERTLRSIYDPSTNTIYEAASSKPQKPGDPGDYGAAVNKQAAVSEAERAAADAKKAAALAADGKRGADEATQPDKTERAPAGEKPDELPAGDPIVAKVRTLLADDRAVVRGRVVHDGKDAWAIGLKPGVGGPDWTLWVEAGSGRPIALLDPGSPSRGDAHQDAHWTAYEVVDPGDAALTLTAAHPDARVVRDDASYEAAEQRLQPVNG
jgi:hypothetical protein